MSGEKKEHEPGDGWVDLDNGRWALQVPGGCIVESYVEDSIAMVFIPDLSMRELKIANEGRLKR